MNNKEIKADLEQWVTELEKVIENYDNEIDALENTLKILKTRKRLVSQATLPFEYEGVKEGFLFTENKNLIQDIKTKEKELENLNEIECKNIFQVRNLIETIKKEIKNIKAAD